MSAESPYANKKVLLVEDDPFLSELITDSLKNEGIPCAWAMEVDRAMAEIKTRKPDLILLDILLPGTDGFTFMERLKAHEETASIQIIILSNLGQKTEIDRGLSMGAVEFLVKAKYTLQDITEKVKKYLS